MGSALLCGEESGYVFEYEVGGPAFSYVAYDVLEYQGAVSRVVGACSCAHVAEWLAREAGDVDVDSGGAVKWSRAHVGRDHLGGVVGPDEVPRVLVCVGCEEVDVGYAEVAHGKEWRVDAGTVRSDPDGIPCLLYTSDAADE